MGLTRPDKVIVVGAGPTGLVLAAELALAGVPCLVLERRGGLRADSRAICLHARSLELLDLRGQAARFTEVGLPVPSFPLGLKGAAIRFGALDSDFPYLLDIPQSQIERLLAGRATELGAEIRWSSRVVGIEPDADEVRVTLESGEVERAAYLVGCDGTRSFVRESAGVPFPGAPNPGSVILADLFLDGLPMTDAYGDLSERGMLLVFPFRDGSCRLVLYDYARAEVPVSEPVTLAEIRVGLARISGNDFAPRDMNWSARYRSESRQVPAYRSGRLFLAGDAAHTHSPAGAQGMNTGLQDAVNLGWKLGAALAGWAPGWLLDTYHAERHPVGAAVLALTGRQFRLNTARSRPRRALRWAAHRVIAPLPPVQSRLAQDYSGVAIRYPPAAGISHPATPAAAGDSLLAGLTHPLAGRRLPRGQLTLPDGSAERLYELFHDGRFVLLQAPGPGPGPGPSPSPSPSPSPGAGQPPLPERVRTVRYARCAGTRLPAAVLVRPDGYVAWASDERDGPARDRAARAAVTLWCAPG
ncbi:MAG TPA: FAD-dependent monooxygenase [Streptosporangiaceae bacterium]|nr:FAD-dependent monooxygenase [Streptosporangiaceae bacterium]